MHKLAFKNHKFQKIIYNYAQILRSDSVKNTDAMKKARLKYSQNVKQLGTSINKNIYNIMTEYCNKKDFTKKEFIEKAIMYYIDNH